MKVFHILCLSIVLLVGACTDVDETHPTIDIDFDGAFPTSCDTLYFGEPFELRIRFSDNEELGAYSINMHNNFNQHSHDTEVSYCILDDKKEAINPYLYIEDFEIPTGITEYEASTTLYIEDSGVEGTYQDGDYHFYISVTDHKGWTTDKGLNVKLLHRK